MKYLILITFITVSSILYAQNLKPHSIHISYLGETITHPGLKIGVTYQLNDWEKKIMKNNGSEKIIQKSIDLSPSIGFYYHKNYQTGLFVLPELSYSRKNRKGNYRTIGLGAGYMRTFIPHVYDFDSSGAIEKIHTGNNYFITNYFITFGKDLNVKNKIPMDIYVKPQMIYALPNVPKGVWYFALEIGVSYKL